MGPCSQCDTLLPVDSRFCPRCGTPAPGADTEELLASAASDPTGLLDRLRAATEGEFRIIRELGRGGMGRVYLAHEIALDRRVAMKVLPPAFAGHEGIVQRFQREARTAGKLSHPNIVPVFQVSKRDDLTFFTMPCVVGPNLRQVMRQTPQLRLELARRYLREAASALGYAHRQGVIHRDIKPENMLLEGSRDGRLLLTDFGIAKALGSGTTLTRPGDVMGTPYYMSPEQCEENEVDGRSDQYSLGLVAYEMLAGRFPFTADSMAGIIYKHLNEDPEPLQNFRADVPADLLSVIVRATQKDPDARFPTMAALIEALGAGAPTVRTTAAPPMKPAAKPPTPRGSRRRGVIAVSGIGLAALAAAAFALWQQRPSPSAIGDAQLAEINVPPAALVGVDTSSETASESPETETLGAGEPGGVQAVDPLEKPSEPEQPAAAPSPGPSREEGERSREKLLSEVESGAQAAHQGRAAALEAGADSLHPGEFDAISRDLRRAQQASRAGRPFVALRGYAQVTARFEELAGRARRDAEEPSSENAADPVEIAPADAIARLLESYRQALEAEDTIALARVVYQGPIPPQNAEFLRQIFSRAQQLSVTLETKRLSLRDARAEAHILQKMNFRLASNRAKRSATFDLVVTFERGADGWRMVSFDRR